MTYAVSIPPETEIAAPSESVTARTLRSGRVVVGGGVLLLILLLCVGTLPWTLGTGPLAYDRQVSVTRLPPLPDLTNVYTTADGEPMPTPPAGARLASLFGYDGLGRSVLGRCLLGGTISLAVGVAAAAIAVFLGVGVGLIAGYKGGLVDSALMRTVDVLYGLPYILLVILFKIAFLDEFASGRWRPGVILAVGVLLIVGVTMWLAFRIFQPLLARVAVSLAIVCATIVALYFASGSIHAFVNDPRLLAPMTNSTASIVVMFLAIGLVSWLTMARVVRGQVLSLRSQPFIEAARAMGLPPTRIFLRHVLPNLIGPVIVYATLTVPQAILQESFLSFLGVGVNPPMPTWGALASEALLQGLNPLRVYWWMLLFPCILLVVTLLSLNFMGDGLRDVFDPKRESAKI